MDNTRQSQIRAALPPGVGYATRKNSADPFRRFRFWRQKTWAIQAEVDGIDRAIEHFTRRERSTPIDDPVHVDAKRQLEVLHAKRARISL